MRKLLLIVIFTVILSLTANATYTFVDFPDILVTFSSQTPDPVEPGQTATLKFKIENEGVQTHSDVIVRLLPNFPFTLYGDSAEKNIGKLRGSATGADAVIVEFKVKVDEAAVEGDTEIELEIEVSDGKTTYTNDEFMIDIQTHDAVLDFTSISTEPEQISPGQTAKLRISVKNYADSLLKDIKFTLNMGGDDLPLAPYQSSSQRRIAQLQTNNQLPLSFQVIADPDAVPGLYKIPLNVTYNDEKGNSYSLNDVVAVLIGDKPAVKAYIKKSTVLQSGKPGKITIELANKGTTDVKFADLSMLPTDDFELISTTNYIYLGDIDSDDTESEEFEVFVNKGVEKLTVPIQLTYNDANNKPFQERFDLELQLYSSKQLKRYGVIQVSYSWVYALIVVIGVAGYFFYKKVWKRKKKK